MMPRGTEAIRAPLDWSYLLHSELVVGGEMAVEMSDAPAGR
jgi:hypothetical protein